MATDRAEPVGTGRDLNFSSSISVTPDSVPTPISRMQRVRPEHVAGGRGEELAVAPGDAAEGEVTEVEVVAATLVDRAAAR